MLNIPDEIKELFRQDNITDETRRTVTLKFFDKTIESLFPYEELYPSETLFPSDESAWLIITNDQIVAESLVIEECLYDGEDIAYGECAAAKCEIIVADIKENLIGMEFLATITIGGYEMAMGYYTVESYTRESDRRKRKIVAYDRMRLFDVDISLWYNSLQFPMNLKSFRDSLCDYIGVEQIETVLLFDDMEVEKTIEPSELPARDVLRTICEINGTFGHFERTGVLKYIRLGLTGIYPSETLYPSETDLYPSEAEGFEAVSHYKQPLTYEDYLVDGIDSLQIRQEDGDIGAIVGSGTNGYIVEGNFLVYGKSSVELLTIASNLYGSVQGRIYRPCSIECNAMPWVEVGDGVIAQTGDDLIETFVFNRTTKGIQGMRDTIVAKGNETREEIFGVNKQIIQLQGKTAVITKNVDEVSVKLADLAAYTEAQFKVTADSILAEVTRASEAEGQLSSRILVNAEQISLKVSKGTVSSEISIESGQVTISGNRLVINSTNLQLDANGNATFSGNIIGAIITGTTINGGNVNGAAFKGGSIDIGNGTFVVEPSGEVYINSGEIELGGIKINESYADLGAYRVSSSRYGVLYSTNGEVTLSTSDWADGGPALELSGSGYKTRVAYGGISTNEIYLSRSWWDGWSLTETMQDVYSRLRSLENEVF